MRGIYYRPKEIVNGRGTETARKGISQATRCSTGRKRTNFVLSSPSAEADILMGIFHSGWRDTARCFDARLPFRDFDKVVGNPSAIFRISDYTLRSTATGRLQPLG
jgi:hypothetical protein